MAESAFLLDMVPSCLGVLPQGSEIVINVN